MVCATRNDELENKNHKKKENMIICPPIREYDFRVPETERPLSAIQCRHQKCEAIGEITCSDDAMTEKRKPKSKYRIRDRITLAKVKTVIQNDNTPVDDAGCEKSIPTAIYRS